MRNCLIHYVVFPGVKFGRRYLCTGQVAELVRLVKKYPPIYIPAQLVKLLVEICFYVFGIFTTQGGGGNESGMYQGIISSRVQQTWFL